MIGLIVVVGLLLFSGCVAALIGGAAMNDQPSSTGGVSTESAATQTSPGLSPTDTGTAAEPDAGTEEASNVPAEYRAALAKASSYSSVMHMSKQGIYDQLTSEYGEKFTPEAAKYAVDNVEADWSQNALEKARSYQEDMDMSPAAIRDQLVSEYGEKFTEAEADDAMKRLEQ